MNQKLNIAFDIQGTWDRDDFRKFIVSLNNDEKVDKIFYIITSPAYATQANVIKELLDLDSSQVITTVTNITQLEAAILANNINYYFSDNLANINTLNNNTAISSAIIPFKGFYANYWINTNTLMMKYIEQFRFELNRLSNEN